MQDNPFAKYASPAPAGGPVYGPGPKQPTALQNNADIRDQTRLDILIQQEEARQRKEAEEQQEKADTEARSKAAMLARFKEDARNIARLGKDASDNGGLGETGMSGATLRGVPGTASYSLGAQLETFKAKNAFAGLSALADQGVKLTPVSNEEIKLAAASIANLDPNADHATFMQAVDQTKQYYYDAIARIDPLEAYQVALENGETADAITAIAQRNNGPMPDPDFLAKAVQYRDDGGAPNPSTFQPPEGAPPSGPDGGGLGQAFYAGVGDVAELAGDTLGIIGNPLNAGINALTGTNLSTDLGQTFREATGAPDGNPIASAINKGAGTALFGAGIANAARPIATGVGSVVTNALAQQPVRQVVGGASAGLSAEVANQMGAPAPVQAAAGLVGGVAGYGAAGLPNALLGPRQLDNVGMAFQRQGVDRLPAEAGGTATKILTSGAKTSPLSAGPIRAQAQKSVSQTQDALNRNIDDLGGSLSTDKAGEAIRKGAQEYASKTSARGERLYTAAYKAASGVRAIKPQKTIQAIDEQIARLQQNPDPAAQSTIKDLQSFRKNLEGGVAIQGLRDARTGLSAGVYDGNLRSGSETAMWKGILKNVADDIDVGLKAAGKGQAAALFKRADEFWSKRVEQIDEVLQPIVGKGAAKGGEQILETIESMARGKMGGNARLSRLLAEMPDDYADQVRATIINRIGKANPGAQNADGDAFAPSTFLTNWNKLTPQAKSSLFADPKLRRNLDDIALISENMKTAEGFSNFSNTAMALAGGGQSVGAVALATLLHPIAVAGIAGTQFMTGKVLANPRFAEWLARTAKINNPKALQAHVKRLDAIAASNPIIANDIASIKQFLGQAPGLSRAAAAEGDNVGEERPIQPQR